MSNEHKQAAATANAFIQAVAEADASAGPHDPNGLWARADRLADDFAATLPSREATRFRAWYSRGGWSPQSLRAHVRRIERKTAVRTADALAAAPEEVSRG